MKKTEHDQRVREVDRYWKARVTEVTAQRDGLLAAAARAKAYLAYPFAHRPETASEIYDLLVAAIARAKPETKGKV